MQFVTKFVCKFCHAEVCLQSVQSLSAALQSLSCRGCAEAAQGLCRGCAGAMQRLYSGCTVAAQWLCRGCARAVQTRRLCRGCIQTNFCRQSLSYCRQSLSTVDKVCHLVDVADELVGMQTNFVSSSSADRLCQQVLQTNFVSSLYSTQYTVYSIQYTDNVCGRYEKVSDFMTNFVICMTN